ncbi:MAG: peptidylprolyl isomerase [Ferruginibacter sp.]|nr:peptidylprolyl isomerase [Bacteroidota bacterium]MBX2918673.1 peptidylprolyl isomerase [Ferruginibacter sp.]MCB0709150.1 peptidylprolyl isomerase [Chitinophagaceae bacterium]MCC7378787.1 peptidylprolyl isomerase [Chitinophagaceae bacterium]
MKKLFVIIICIAVASCSQKKYKNPHIIINTRLGDIEVELFPDQAPKTTAAFLSYIDSGFYKNSSFYRVLKTEDFPTPTNTGIIQGGIWQTNPQKKESLQGIELESTKQTGLSHQSGTISLARTTPSSATTEFFICIGDQSPLDAGRRGTPDGLGFAAFGKVFSGMDVVRKIQAQKSSGDHFDEKIVINNITRL